MTACRENPHLLFDTRAADRSPSRTTRKPLPPAARGLSRALIGAGGACLAHLVEDLALGLTRLEVLVAVDGVLEVEDFVDADVEVARLEPAEDLVGAHHQLVARAH